MRRFGAVVAVVVSTMAAVVAAPSGSPSRSADSVVSILFGINAREESALGNAYETLTGRGSLQGPGTSLGSERLEPQPDDHGLAPRITYVRHRLTGEHTYRMVVNSARYLKGPRRSTLTLSVEVYDSTDPGCRERQAGSPGARGNVVLFEASDGTGSATLDLPCIGSATWDDENTKLVLDSVICPTRLTKAAGKCARKAPATTTPAAGTYVLVSSKLTENPYGKEVTATPAGSGTWDHCCGGGAWKIHYTWKFPTSLIPGKPFSISMALKTASVVPSQPLADQMTALAPDFRQDLTTNYPGQPANSKTYTVPFSKAFKTDPNNKEIKLYVGFAHATVVFTYRRTGG